MMPAADPGMPRTLNTQASSIMLALAPVSYEGCHTDGQRAAGEKSIARGLTTLRTLDPTASGGEGDQSSFSNLFEYVWIAIVSLSIPACKLDESSKKIIWPFL